MSGSGPPGWKEVEEALWNKAERGLKELKGLRRPEVNDVFERKLYLGPSDFYEVNYHRRYPMAAFNPGAALDGDKLLIFVRLVFEFYGYVSSVGLAEVSVEDVLEGRVGRTPLPTRIVLWPKELWEQLGCEDPRVFKAPDNRWLIFYCARGYYWLENKMVRTDAQAVAEFNTRFGVIRRGYFSIRKGDAIWAPSNRHSTPLLMNQDKAVLATRPVIRGKKLCWRADADLNQFEMPEESLEPVIAPENWETHIGWSTNAVKLSNDEYLIGWHGASRYDMAYRNGIAILDADGELLAISNYILSPKGLYEEYGDRCMTLFGCGLACYKDILLWVGGVCDACVGFFVTELEKSLETLRWLKG